eukprot:15056596-Alexandrium_andersonii.AAC.1
MQQEWHQLERGLAPSVSGSGAGKAPAGTFRREQTSNAEESPQLLAAVKHNTDSDAPSCEM